MAATVVNFATGVPRITNKGLLVEEARTNLRLRSQEFGNAAWASTALTVTSDAIAAPDGTMTADFLVPTAASAIHRINQSVAIPTATAYTFSVYAKAGGFRYLYINGAASPAQGQATFDLQTGTITANPTGTATIEALANGWYRCIVTGTSATTTNQTYLQVNNASTAADNTYSGDGTSGIYLWGAQLEAGAFATSYIPTTSASATRAIDVAAVTGIPTPSAGFTLYVEFVPVAIGASTQALVQFDDGTQNNRALIYLPGSSTVTYIIGAGGVTQATDPVGGTCAVGTVCKAAVRFEANNFRGAVNGTLGTADTSGTLPTAPTAFRVGCNSAGATPANAYIRRAQLIPRALSDAELQALTT